MNDIGCLIINDANTSTVLLGIKYIDKSHCSPINTTRNPFLHYLLLLANPMNEVRITAKTLGITETPESSMILASTEGGGGGVIDVKPVKDAIYSFYESIGIKKMAANWREYRKFLEYWQRTKSETYNTTAFKSK